MGVFRGVKRFDYVGLVEAKIGVGLAAVEDHAARAVALGPSAERDEIARESPRGGRAQDRAVSNACPAKIGAQDRRGLIDFLHGRLSVPSIQPIEMMHASG